MYFGTLNSNSVPEIIFDAKFGQIMAKIGQNKPFSQNINFYSIKVPYYMYFGALNLNVVSEKEFATILGYFGLFLANLWPN